MLPNTIYVIIQMNSSCLLVCVSSILIPPPLYKINPSLFPVFKGDKPSYNINIVKGKISINRKNHHPTQQR